MKKSLLRNERGFTLIEVISVLVILGILAAVAVPKYIDLQEEARKKSAMAAVAEVKARLSMAYGKYLLEEGTPPTTTLKVCGAVGTDTLPATCTDEDYEIGDYTVALTTDGTVVSIDVTHVQDKEVDVEAESWTLPTADTTSVTPTPTPTPTP